MKMEDCAGSALIRAAGKRLHALSWLACICLGSLLILEPSPAWSQPASTGTISGVVTDQQAAAVGAAEAVLTDLSTNSKRTTSTNEVGRYIFVDLPPGQYTLTVTKPGFKQARIAQQTVDVGFVLTLNVSLEVGATTTSVE